jgi:cobalt-zinc-cadmium efflux system membrane fusion protein
MPISSPDSEARMPMKTFPCAGLAARVSVIGRPSVLAGLCCMLLAACGDKPQDSGQAKAPAAAVQNANDAAQKGGKGGEDDSFRVRVSPDMAAQFKSEALVVREITTSQEVVGRIEANEKRVTRIGAAVTGRVTEVLVDVGDRVQRGQNLALVSSPELTQAQLAYLRAHAARELAERAEERAQLLLRADVIGSAELQRRQSELAIASAELKAAADHLQIMGLSSEVIARLRQQGSLHPHAVVSSPLSGVVIERKVSQGQVAQPGDPLFTVADLSRVWVVGEIPEQTARSAQVGQSVQIEVPALGQKTWTGRIVFVGDTVNPETRTVTIRSEVENNARALKPQMLATMKIATASERLPAVPQAAVVREQDRDHLFIDQGAGQFVLVPVRLGDAVDGLRPVLEGVKSGERIVVEGAFHLNNERKRAELQ